MTDLLTTAIRALEKAGARFGDIRLEDRSTFLVRIANEQIQTLNDVRRRGWGLRAFVDGAWGYASGTTMDAASVKEAAKKATAMARSNVAAGVPRSKLAKMPSVTRTAEPNLKIDPRDVSGEEKVAAAMEVCRAQRIDRISSTSSACADSDFRFELANTWGARIAWREVRARIFGVPVAAEGDRHESITKFVDGTGGWEVVKDVDRAALGREAAQDSVEMLRAVKPPSGLMTVVVDPPVAGLLAHEVMGHSSEGDEIVKHRSFLTGQVGKRVGSRLVTMYDDGTYPGAHGTIPFDGEGTPARKTTIIERGVYRGYMHSLETSGVMKTKPTGNGRAQDFSRRVWVRMTNTYFAPGKDPKDDLIEETKSGVLTGSWVMGMEDPVGGGFQAVTQSGFLIKDGEVGARVRGMTLTGKALEILKSVDMISKEFALDGGNCGKGDEDYVPVSAGGPYMRCKVIVGGG